MDSIQNTASNALIVSLSIKSPQFSAKDTTVSEAVTNHAGIEKSAARVWKSLFPKNEHMKAVGAAERELRNFHYLHTLPYMYDGQRILPTANLEAYMQGYRLLKRKFEDAAEKFVEVYPTLIEEAKLFLKDMFNEKDYPSQEAIATRFNVSIRRSPVPVGDTYFQLGVKAEDAETMRKELEADMQATFEAANKALWERTYSSLKSFVEQLSDPKKRIRPETIPAIKEMLSILPRMNMTGDKRLDELANGLLASLDGINYHVVKEDETAAIAARASTEAMCSAMGMFMGGGMSMPTPSEKAIGSPMEFFNHAKAA